MWCESSVATILMDKQAPTDLTIATSISLSATLTELTGKKEKPVAESQQEEEIDVRVSMQPTMSKAEDYQMLRTHSDVNNCPFTCITTAHEKYRKDAWIWTKNGCALANQRKNIGRKGGDEQRTKEKHMNRTITEIKMKGKNKDFSIA